MNHDLKFPRTPLHRRSALAQQIYDALVEEIVTGTLAPGAPVVEAELRERFQVSRTPIREVLLRLSEVGLIEIYPQVGSYVTPIRLPEAYEALFVREHLECALAREAADKLTPDYAAELRANLDSQREALQSEAPQRFMATDEAMHALIARIADKPGVWQVVLLRKLHLDRIRLQALRQLTRASQAFEEHRQICDAILARDGDRAAHAMRIHIQASQHSIDLLGLSTDQAPSGSAAPQAHQA